jgi:hypothetical protein
MGGGRDNIKTSKIMLLSSSEISELAIETDISLGKNAQSEAESIRVIQEAESGRAGSFNEQCSICQEGKCKDKESVEDTGVHVVDGEVAPSTPVLSRVNSNGEKSSEQQGQWTLVVNRKKSKSRLIE